MSEIRTDADLVLRLEKLTGRTIKSRQDIRAYVDELQSKAGTRAAERQLTKDVLLAVLFAAAFAQYYFLDVQIQILSQPAVTVFVPVGPNQDPVRIGG